jgi:hypothetical protein
MTLIITMSSVIIKRSAHTFYEGDMNRDMSGEDRGRPGSKSSSATTP